MKHHPRTTVFIALMMLMLCVAPAMGEKVTPNTDLMLNESELKLSTDLLSLTNSSILQTGTSQTGLVSDLQIKPASQSVKQRGLNAGVQATSQIVSVYVMLDQQTSLSTVDPFAWEVSNRDESSRTVVAWVELSRLLALASVPGVRQVRPVLPPVVNMGSVMTEGDRIHLADQVRATYGLTGAGVRIGIISDGVDHWNTAAATGDLPTNLHVLRNDQGGDEGTAMLEIVHDIAPDAELYFCDHGSNTLDFADGIDALADAGCTIICDDISWINDPFFEDGALAAHIQSLTSTRNILYFSSAGNSAQRHYQGMYHKDGTTNWNDFSGGTAQADRSLYVSIPPGGYLRTVLEWDDPWTGSTNDYDLYLLTRGGEYLLARSTVVQNGDDAPLELISVINGGSSTIETEIDVLNRDGAAADRTLEIFMYPGGGTRISGDNIVGADSVFGHAAATNVVAVGAISASDPGADTIEYFSSLGPATICYPGTVQRSKPDITGIDGVSITGSGGFPSPFYGTSASAPDVAAVTALVWSGARTRAASEVRTALLSSSDDLGSAGPDNTFGYGRANAVAFAQALGIAPAITAGFHAFGHVGQAPYSVRFLDRSTGSPTAWHWDFGDGTTSDEQNPTHIYNQTGACNVALTASNDQRSDTVIQYRCIIVNTVPAANFTANATAGKAPFTVQFTDQSTGATGYQWQFGDGTTSTEQNPVHIYMQPGTYTVTQVVSRGEYGSVFVEKPGYITVTDPPTVGFSSNVTTGLSPLSVQFNESVNGSVQYYYWQFGDGVTSFDRNPVHVYADTGMYTVSLYAIGQNGTQVKTADKYINVTDPVVPTPTPNVTATMTPAPTEQYLPAANFTVTTGASGSLAIQVADTSVNATSVQYDLGDGTTTTIRNFRYIYSQAGTYTIDQTATNAAGSSHKTLSVTVPAVEPTTTFPPIGGDLGWYTIHCNVDGATVTFDETPMGTIADGILKIQIYTTGTPYQTYTVQKDGYSTDSGIITEHPNKGENVDITVTLTPGSAATPYNGPHPLPGLLEAEDYDLGGEGVAYHDTTAGNTGGAYRQDDVDIEMLDLDNSPNVGWIRSGEWLTYTVNVSTAGTYDAGFRVASSHAGSSVHVYLDDGTTPVATVNVPNTGDWPVFRTISVPVTLPAGQHRLKLVFPTDYVNINWINFVQSSGLVGMIR